MQLLIDGYNLMFQSIASKQGMNGANALREARGRLIELIIGLIDVPMRSQTMIVFDAKDAPKGLPDQYQQQGMQIVFARDWDSADELIQTEIRKHPTPKKLTVVSSDHAIHRKAKARGATVLDCEDWIDRQIDAQQAKLRENNAADAHDEAETHDARHRELSDDEKKKWLNEFGF